MKNVSRLQVIEAAENLKKMFGKKRLNTTCDDEYGLLEGWKYHSLREKSFYRFTYFSLYSNSSDVAIATFNEFKELAEKYESLTVEINSGHYSETLDFEPFFVVRIQNFEKID